MASLEAPLWKHCKLAATWWQKRGTIPPLTKLLGCLFYAFLSWCLQVVDVGDGPPLVQQVSSAQPGSAGDSVESLRREAEQLKAKLEEERAKLTDVDRKIICTVTARGAPDPELCYLAGSGSVPDPDMSDLAGSGSEPDPNNLDPAGSGSKSDPYHMDLEWLFTLFCVCTSTRVIVN